MIDRILCWVLWPFGKGRMFMGGTCIHCGKENHRGHRKDETNLGSSAGAVYGIAGRSGIGRVTIPIADNTIAAVRASATVAPVAVVHVGQEIIAERCWKLSQDEKGPVLMSVAHHVAWEGPTLTAHEKPAEGNHSGIYAQATLEDSYAKLSVVGQVALSGAVVEGERGYRAERAVIRSLRLRSLPALAPCYSIVGGWLPSITFGGYRMTWKKRAWEVAALLAERYQCECTIDWIPTSDLPADELVA